VRTFERGLAAVAATALLVIGVACSGGEDAADPVPRSSSRPRAVETVTPIPEGQSLMDPGSYVAQTNPAITLTTTSTWYGAANVPGFVVMGQLDHFPYSELYLINLDEVVEEPGDPGDPVKLRPVPEDLLGWLVDSAGMEVAGAVTPVEIDGFHGEQADLRVRSDVGCAPKDVRPFPGTCLLFFKIPEGGRLPDHCAPRRGRRDRHAPLHRLRRPLRRTGRGGRRGRAVDRVRRLSLGRETAHAHHQGRGDRGRAERIARRGVFIDQRGAELRAADDERSARAPIGQRR
jgi:hypothetical protein